MDCEFTPNISLMIDGALSPEEAVLLEDHIGACAKCSAILDEFLSLRVQIKSLIPERDRLGERRALARIISPGAAPIWTRRLSIPFPLLVAVAAAFIAVFGWSLSVWRQRQLLSPAGHVTRISPDHAAVTGLDLSRFDHDKAPIIVKVQLDRSGSRVDGGVK